MTDAQTIEAVYAALSQYIGFGLVILIISLVAYWKIFTKAGVEGWKAIIPIYNIVVLFKIVGLSPWLILTAIIPFVGGIIFWVISIIMNVKLAKVFGKSGLFAVGLIFLTPIFLLILAFGSAEYTAPEEN